MPEENIIPVGIEDEMQRSYIDYAMSVIVGRALPDVRDGLKPVHRRILYAMNELGLTPDKPYRKSARIVGDVLGKYHPHGDAAVYDAMVRMSQDFSIRYPLVDGHGNMGSIDGDPPAAMRYTEARLSRISLEMLAGINEETVDFMPNFDDTLKEPTVLPSRFPNLLVNGSQGIAVGMATNIPSHNLNEIVDGIIALIDDPDIDIDGLMKFVKGPDFPTGASIMGTKGIKDAYYTGRGKIILRSKVEIEEAKGRSRILIKEIPYMVNKAKLVENIANLIKDKKIDGIADLRDESDRTGMRVVLELKRDANPNVILNTLYAHTQLQDTFGVIMLALVRGVPKVLNLKDMMVEYLNFQKEVVTRKTRYELNKAQERAHILEGLRIALDHIDEVINLIRSSATTQEAKSGLIDRFGLSEKQAQAILDMRLQRLTGLERKKIDEEYEGLLKNIAEYNEILSSESRLLNVIKDDLIRIKEKYGDKRRTEIIPEFTEIDMEDLIKEEDVVVTITHFGYIKRIPLSNYRSQRRGGKGLIGITTREEDFVEDIFITSTHDNLLFFTNQGNVYRLRSFDIPEESRQAKGTALVNLIQLRPGEKVNAVLPVRSFDESSAILMVTRTGLIKKTDLNEYGNVRKTGIKALSLEENDELISVRLAESGQEIIIGTKNGMCIRFSEKDVRTSGRTSKGVTAIELDKDDEIIGMDLIDGGGYVLTVTENGFGKRTPTSEYRLQARRGKGIKAYNRSDKNGYAITIRVVQQEDDLMITTLNGNIIRLKVSDIPELHRNSQGVRLIRLDDGDKVVSIARVRE
ncbi:DNA gyrase subunit A [Calorimonas adulescens]|uniref:DNA gyrase subunit A n=1 Tax=Calorimonas adulescens TaxID=2606906 RepID=A0A5D8Q8D9_9THEO|nr:DNA gyrase subunit A [Calorimonas adulescens]TZE80771.1 DNA gyrase subunit A [Calorimonas adulescens]